MERFMKKRPAPAPVTSPNETTRANKPDPMSSMKAPKMRRCSLPEQAGEEDVPGDEEEHGVEPEDPLLDLTALTEIAANTWAADDEVPANLHSRSFATDSWHALPDGRLPFRLVAAALECEPQKQLSALTNVFRWVLKQSSDGRADVKAVVAMLTSPPTLHPQLVHAVGTTFKLKTSPGDPAVTQYKGGDSMTAYRAPNVPAEDLPDLALHGRRSQRVLFSKKLSVAEVAAALAPDAGQHSAKATPEHENHAKPFTQLLGKATPDHREIWHLVRILQGVHGLASTIVLRALAYALQLPSSPAAIRPELMARYDMVLFRAWAEHGVADPDWLMDQLLPGKGSPSLASEALEAVTRPQTGCWVRPMKAQDSGTIEEALSKLSGVGAVRAEWLIEGQRVQIHVKEGGSKVQVFESRGICTSILSASVADEVSSILKGNLRAVDDAILEAVLMRPFRAESETAEASVYGIVFFDVLLLNGAPLTRSTLRARRMQLEAAVAETGRLRLAPGVELAEGLSGTATAKTELVKALGASAQGDSDEAKAMNRALGVVLKALDGSAAEYFPGLSTPNWEALSQPPAVQGAEAEKALFDALTDAARAKLPEADEFHFCVVSARRTQTEEGVKDILTVQRQFSEAGVSPCWYVDAESLDDYRALGLDAKVGGKLIPARNMALDDAERLGKACVQISDDIEKWLYLAEQGGWTKKKSLREANAAGRVCLRYKVSPVAAARFLLAMMRGSGKQSPQLGGVLPHHNPGQAMNADPCTYKGFILGDFFVVDKSPCRFDVRMTLKEDYDLTAAHMKAHGCVFRYNHLCVYAKHETNAGGACSIRDSQGERERENIKILMDKYPGAFRENPKRPNQVVFMWGGHLKWLRENAKANKDNALP
mmetsp:Transcript_11236/g.21198  ORF Transcript_11236/g.21198 Transcript_11236/m.21198 type:complete len:883 (-) Transcript_11236:120-2768(-)